MKIAFFSPLPPAQSGIADYAAALLDAMRALAQVDAFAETPASFDPDGYDAILYHLGNNPFHSYVYEMALRYPGIIVLHEANLHHLIADLTIRRNDWDAYMREVEFDGGAPALAFAERVRALEVGPDYDGVPMLKRILSASRGVIVHSRFVADQVKAAGFPGPVRVIPHGAAIPTVDRKTWRNRLGLPDESTPLIGIFGFLKPYKRITESLRAFRRLLKVTPKARLLLCGESHPDLPLPQLFSTLGLNGEVRHIDFAPLEDFVGYIAACDIILNLRYPTVGETSGTLQRALGLGRAVMVSDVGSFAEYPDEICLKVPVDALEEDLIFEYLRVLTSRPDLAQAMGDRARRWIETECSWETVAQRYVDFLERPEAGDARPETFQKDAILAWTGSNDYVEAHLTRLAHTLEITPPGSADDAVLEMGAYMHITPALHYELGYGTVRGCYYGPAGQTDSKTVRAADGREFHCEVDLFDAEKDPFPYADESFATVLCCELIEHLPSDPMHTLAEINRVLRLGGHLVLTTPNIASLRAVAAILNGRHPGFFATYLKPEKLAEGDSRHNREYTAREVYLLLHYAGFDITLLETGPFLEKPEPELDWVKDLLKKQQLDTEYRGDGTYIVGKKAGPIRERWPDWLYSA